MISQISEYEYSKELSEDKFWKNAKKHAMMAGKAVIFQVLTLLHTMRDKETPLWAKSTILGALVYFICPLDAIPDVIPVVG